MESTENHLSDQMTAMAAEVVAQAEAVTARFKHAEVTTDHVFLGMLEILESDATRLLTALPIDVLAVRDQVESMLEAQPKASDAGTRVVITEDVRALFTQAAIDMQTHGHTAIDSLNLLSGLLHTDASQATQALKARGLTTDMVYSRLRFAKEQAYKVPKQQQALNELKAPDSVGEAIRKVVSSLSPIFIGLVALFLGSGYLLWADIVSNRLMVFLYVTAGWLVSLALHEFGHAFVAYIGGDYTVEQKGYLTLDLRKYTHFALSIAMPLLFLMMGGIGLPGGAVYVQRNLVRNRHMHSLISAAGPIANIVFTLVLALPFLLFRYELILGGTLFFWSGTAFLIFLQITALALNLLPIPGLDGFGIIAPYLPHNILAVMAPLSRYGILILFALLWFPNPMQDIFWSSVMGISGLILDTGWIWEGYGLYRFWEQ